MKRQNIRKLTLLISLLLFPVTLYYFSPAIIAMAGAEGVANGSFIVFAAIFAVGVFAGRPFCAYICPAGALQEAAFGVCAKPAVQGWKNYIKYGVWIVWLAAVVFLYARSGGVSRVDFLYQTDRGVSVSEVAGYGVYYAIVLLVLASALIGGKRAFCHYFCWMAPFMVVGALLGRLLRVPGLRVAATPGLCVSCHRCNQACPMGVEPELAAERGRVDSAECIACGACADACPKKVFRVGMGARVAGARPAEQAKPHAGEKRI